VDSLEKKLSGKLTWRKCQRAKEKSWLENKVFNFNFQPEIEVDNALFVKKKQDNFELKIG
jgi:hypothetical protein